MFWRFLAAAVFLALAGCASAPYAGNPNQALRACDGDRDAGACRELALQLAIGDVPRMIQSDAEEAVLKACWADRLIDAKVGTDLRWRLCYEVGKHFSARAVHAMDGSGTSLKKTAANLYLRACELGQPLACRQLLSECLVLDEEICRAPPSEEQAFKWSTQRRERDARVHAQ